METLDIGHRWSQVLIAYYTLFPNGGSYREVQLGSPMVATIEGYNFIMGATIERYNFMATIEGYNFLL